MVAVEAGVEEPASTTGPAFLEKKPNTMMVVKDRGTCMIMYALRHYAHFLTPHHY
jgi:hypothetical protein